MEPDEDPDVRLRASGGVSDRLFICIMIAVLLYFATLLAGCGYLFRVTTSSDGNNVTGDFMIGEPHESTINQVLPQGVQGPERFDVQSRIENTEFDRLSED